MQTHLTILGNARDLYIQRLLPSSHPEVECGNLNCFANSTLLPYLSLRVNWDGEFYYNIYSQCGKDVRDFPTLYIQLYGFPRFRTKML